MNQSGKVTQLWIFPRQLREEEKDSSHYPDLFMDSLVSCETFYSRRVVEQFCAAYLLASTHAHTYTHARIYIT